MVGTAALPVATREGFFRDLKTLTRPLFLDSGEEFLHSRRVKGVGGGCTGGVGGRRGYESREKEGYCPVGRQGGT